MTVIFGGEFFSVMKHHNVTYNKIKMDYYFCDELFPVLPCPTLSWNKIKNIFFVGEVNNDIIFFLRKVVSIC